MTKYQNIALALAGITQSVTLVQRLANEGYCQNELFKQTIKPIFVTDPIDTESTFGGKQNIQLGLEKLSELLNSASIEQKELFNYFFSLLFLQGKLLESPESLHKIAEKIAQLKPIFEEENYDLNEFQLHQLAQIYSEFISPLGKKIRIFGKPELLQNSNIQNKVRSLLFAGIRSAVLWKQVGGSRWDFMFHRKRIANAAKSLL